MPLLRLLCLLSAVFVTGVARSDDAPFSVTEIASPGRTTAAELADLDGDGRSDVFQVVFISFPPTEERWVRVFHQGEDGSLPPEPTRVWRLPSDCCAAYDLADLLPEPGIELVLLMAREILIVSLDRRASGETPTVHRIALPEPSLAPAQDERGLDRARLVWHGLGEEPWLLVPVAGQFVALDATGRERARLEVGTRANYYIPPPGAALFEGELQVFLDVPLLVVGDVDGDGRRDVLSAGRHDLRVFLRREDGSFPMKPDQRVPLQRVTRDDHLRGSGAVQVDGGDVNGDGRLDLLVSQVSGAFTDAHTRTTLHLNRGGAWNLQQPDQEFESKSSWSADRLLDLDGDQRPELVRIRIPITVLEIVEVLVTRAIDAQVTVHRSGSDGRFDTDPWIRRKLGIPFSFATARPKGFLPTIQVDLNGDGQLDFLSSTNGESIEVFLGGDEHRFKRRHARQQLPTQGRVRFGDWNDDQLSDFVLYAPRVLEAPLRLGTNLGRLPGTPERPPRMVPVGEE